MIRHIFVATNQWKACKVTAENLGPDAVMMIEDYQQNISLTHQEETTTAHFSVNITQIACFPCIVKFKVEGEEKARKGGIVFLSEDRKHDHQQVAVFEKEVFKYMLLNYNIKVRLWHR